MPNRNKETADGELLGGTTHCVFKNQRFSLLFAKHLDHFAVEVNLDLLVCLGACNHDLAGAEGVTTDEKVHLGGKARQEERLFKCGVATTNDCHLFALEEEAVTGGT